MIFPPMPESMFHVIVWGFLAVTTIDIWIIFKLFGLDKKIAVIMAVMPKRKQDNGGN